MILPAVTVLSGLIAAAYLVVGFPKETASPVWRFITKVVPVALLAGAAWLVALPPLLVLALALSAVGDAFLTRDGATPFVAGMAAFAVAQVAYILLFWAGLERVFSEMPWYSFGLIAAVSSAVFVVLRVRLGSAVAAIAAGYAAVLLTMAIASLGTGVALLGIGGVLFVLSDLSIGLQIADRRLAWLGRVVWLTYWPAQACLLWGVSGT